MTNIWKKITLNDCCTILDNFRIPINATEREKMKGHIPYFGATKVQGYIDKYIFDEPLILISEDGGDFDDYASRPIAYRINGKSWVNNHAHVLKAKEGFSQDFIFFSLVHKNILKFIKGGTRTKLNQSELKNIEIDIPKSKEEQDYIVQILDSVAKVIEDTKKIILKKYLIKKGLIQDLLKQYSDFITPELYTFASAIDIDHKMPHDVEFGIPFISAKDISDDGEIDFDNVKLISNSDYERLSKKIKPKIGDVIYTRIGNGLGKAALVKTDKKFLPSYSCCVVRVNKFDIIPEFLVYFLNSEMFKPQLYRQIQSIGVPDLGLDKIHGFIIIAPKDPELQKEISNQLDIISNSIKLEKDYLSKLSGIKMGLLNDLLKKKILVTPIVRR